jgi:hypothetical protein
MPEAPALAELDGGGLTGTAASFEDAGATLIVTAAAMQLESQTKNGFF